MKREKSALKNNLRQLLNCQGVAGLQCRCLLGQSWKRFVIHSCQTSPGCGALEADAWQLRGAPCKSLCWEDFCSLCLKLVWILETVSSTATCLSTSQVFLSDYQKKRNLSRRQELRFEFPYENELCRRQDGRASLCDQMTSLPCGCTKQRYFKLLVFCLTSNGRNLWKYSELLHNFLTPDFEIWSDFYFWLSREINTDLWQTFTCPLILSQMWSESTNCIKPLINPQLTTLV